MDAKLTKTLMHNAAVRISEGTEFMCFAIEDELAAPWPVENFRALLKEYGVTPWPVENFRALLKEHGVSTGGDLQYAMADGRRIYFDGTLFADDPDSIEHEGADEERQNVRFMFLYLLAYSGVI